MRLTIPLATTLPQLRLLGAQADNPVIWGRVTSVIWYAWWTQKPFLLYRNERLSKMGSFHQSKRSDNKWYAVEVRWSIFIENLTYFLIRWSGRKYSHTGSCNSAMTVIALDDHLTAGAWDACDWTLTLFVICNSWSRQDASDPEKCFINSQIETFHPQHPLHDSQMNKVHFPLFFYVV